MTCQGFREKLPQAARGELGGSRRGQHHDICTIPRPGLEFLEAGPESPAKTIAGNGLADLLADLEADAINPRFLAKNQGEWSTSDPLAVEESTVELGSNSE